MSEKQKIVAILGMEQYNRKVWTDVKSQLSDIAHVDQFSDVDLENKNPVLSSAIKDADCIFVSMIQFKDQVDFLKAQVEESKAQTVFVFESMPEAMEITKVGNYVMKGKGGGMPDSVKKIAKMLVRGRDEDALYGYVKLLKIMRTMLPLIPKKARDFKNWMTVYSYWSQPVAANITNMFRIILNEYFDQKHKVEPAIDVPTMGVYHPDAPDYFKDIKSYKNWNEKHLKAKGLDLKNAPKVGLIYMRKHLLQEKTYIDDTIRAYEAKGFYALPCFVMGVEGHVVVRDWLTKEKPDSIVNMIGFGLVGGPAGSTKPGAQSKVSEEILSKIDAPYIVAHPLFMQDFNSWGKAGVAPMQATITYAIPEMDGSIAPIVLGALANGQLKTVPDRLERLTNLTKKWADLRHISNKDKKLAFIVYDYPPGLGKKATAALLDVPRSLFAVLKRLEREGYNVGNLPDSHDKLFEAFDHSTDYQKQQFVPDSLRISRDDFNKIVSPREREKIDERWQPFPGDIVPLQDDSVFLGGLRYGNIYIGIQPRIGVAGDPMRLLFDKKNTPHHQYIAFYRYVSRIFKANAMIHVGMHGSVEWMPGLQLGMNRKCWSDLLLGEVPHLYMYPVNNPSESSIAKRRGYATMISHAIPPISRSGLYKELPALKDMVADFRERGMKGDEGMEEAITKKIELLNINDDCPRVEGETFIDYMSRVYVYLKELEMRLITSTLHTFGDAAPIDSQVTTITESLKVRGNENSLPSLILKSLNSGSKQNYSQLATTARKGDKNAIDLRERVDLICKEFIEKTLFEKQNPAKTYEKLTNTKLTSEIANSLEEILHEGALMIRALSDNKHELDAIVKLLNGGFIPSGPGGDLIRDGLNILPTGRNIHAIDPWRIPSELAFARGKLIADAILERHCAENNGQYPETIAEVLWGLDTIKTKGEAVATIIRLMGGRPAYDGQNKISHYELIPMSELKRPRVDVLMQLSPVFRDAFGLLMNLLDKLVKDAAVLNEPHEMNFIKKHVDEALAQGISFESATARLFTQSPGAYGTYVDDMIEDSAWENDDELDSQFIRRNSFAYGANRNGVKESEVLKNLLGSVSRVVHQVDSVEFGISDIDHYFSTSGALQLSAKKRNPNAGDVKLNYVESFTADTKIDDVDKALRVEYRTKLLNPKWYEGMMSHGSSGAAEISNRFTYMLGWDAVTKSVDDWVYQKASETYALDPKMRERLQKANPQAMKNIVSRLLEANGRGLWKADENTLEQLRELYADLEDRLEGIQV